MIQAHPPAALAGIGLRILIHAHFHYPELLEDFLRRLSGNALTADLFITTTSEAKAADIREILKAQNRRATIVVVPNRGRDIGPLLMHFPEFENYDIVGHLHGKRSPQQSGAQGDNWRNFLWDHLIGGDTPMMDVIVEAFAADERLGLVFPEDPNLNHWDMNQSLANALAERLGPATCAATAFRIPQGHHVLGEARRPSPARRSRLELERLPHRTGSVRRHGPAHARTPDPVLRRSRRLWLQDGTRSPFVANGGAAVSPRSRCNQTVGFDGLDRRIASSRSAAMPSNIGGAVSVLDEGASGPGA